METQNQSQHSSIGNLNHNNSRVKKIPIIISGILGSLVVLFILSVLLIVFWSIGIPFGSKYVDGIVIDADTKTPLPQIKVTVSNRGWGMNNGQIIWDKDYIYSDTTDQQGKFSLVYNVGSSAHVVIKQNGYETFDNWFGNNTKITIQLKRVKQTTINPTSNWKTYQGSGYSIKYPPEIKVTSNNNEDLFISANLGSMKLIKSKTTSKDIFEEFNNKKLINSGFCKLGGYDAYCITGDPVGSEYYLVKYNIQYRIIPPSASIDSIFHQILQTFKFSDQKSLDATSEKESPEATTLDIDFKASGITLIPVNSANATNSIWWNSHAKRYGASDNYQVSAKKYFFVGYDSTALTDLLNSQNWSWSIMINNNAFNGDGADGPCGGIQGFIGHKNGQLRSINIEKFRNPCCADDDHCITDPNREGGVYVNISDIVSINQVITSKR